MEISGVDGVEIISTSEVSGMSRMTLLDVVLVIVGLKAFGIDMVP